LALIPNAQKSYGFIQPDDGSKDVLVHISAVESSGVGNLHEGQKLSYELERGQLWKISAVSLRAPYPVARCGRCRIGSFAEGRHTRP
jgi:cold shock protein